MPSGGRRLALFFLYFLTVKGVARMYQALYRKWRPKTFDDVAGQEHITTTLKNELTHDRISHAYLFTGSRGTGKTTCAKILAKAVNCLNPRNGSPCGECEICREIDNGTSIDVFEMERPTSAVTRSISSTRCICSPPSPLTRC